MSNDVIKVVESMEPHFNKALSTTEIKWVKECAFAKQQLIGNDFLRGVAEKNILSLQYAIQNIASIGISLNPAQKHAYLVPRDGKVCLDISYMGILNLAMQSGAIEWGQAKIVYENDNYENNGIDKPPTHKQKTFGDKGKIVGVYCTVKLPSGDYLTEEMDMEALNKIRNTSKAANGPWKTWPEEMMRKSVVKRASKYWPQSARVSEAIEAINEHEGLTEEYASNNPYTQAQKELFFDMIEKNDCLGVYLIQDSLCSMEDQNIEGWTRLVSAYQNTAPKGNKTKYGETVVSMVKVGEEVFIAIREAIANDDEMGVSENIEECHPATVKLLKRKLPEYKGE